MAKECDSKTCDKSSCEGCASKKNPQSMQAAMNAMSNVKHVIGIISGKGGVGKSFVTASLANRMAKKGYKVGILDADITRTIHPENVRPERRCPGKRQRYFPYGDQKRNQGYVH